MKVSIGARTDVGQVRQGNEDSMLVESPLFVIADGMGGHIAGDVASATAVEVIGQMYRQHPPADPSTLETYIEEANRAIHEKARSEPQLSGMGTTCTLVHLDGDVAHFAHVGDSRAYLFRSSELSQITQDHTLVERMVQEGRLRREEAQQHPQRNIITRSLGVEPQVEVDSIDIGIDDGDRLMLCSDGLTSMVEDEKIAEILRSSAEAQEAADRLVDAANAAGGEDNITVVVVDVGSSSGNAAPLPPPAPREDTSPAVRDEDPEPPRPRRRWPRRVLITLLLGILIAGGAYFAIRFSLNNSYFVGATEDGYVAIYTGIPDEVGGVSLREEHEVTDILVDDLPESLRDNVEEGIKVDSLDEAQTTVENLRERSLEFGGTDGSGSGSGTGGNKKGSGSN